MTTPLISIREHLINEIRLLKDRNRQKELQGDLSSLNYLFCVICRREIQPKEELIQCAKCQNKFHKKHLAIWINQKNECPICHRKIPLNHNQS